MKSKDRRSQVVAYLNQLLERDPKINSHPKWNQRLGEVIAAAGFGHASLYHFHRDELCVGQYIPDRRAIREIILQRGFDESLTDRFLRHFTDALFSVSHDCRADLIDDLDGPDEMLDGRRVNELSMRQWLDFWLDDEDLHSRRIFKQYILDDNPEDGLFKYEYRLPAGFPTRDQLNTTLVLPIIARYDLDGGADPLATARNQNRQLALSGTMILKPSGPRGWMHPTIQYDEGPIRDDRNEYERNMQPNPRHGTEYDHDLFEAGMEAARSKSPRPPLWNMSESWLAGYIMRGDGCIAHAHMGTGRVDAAFFDALARAEALKLPNAADLAANACRHLASTRCAQELEDVIAEYRASLGDDGGLDSYFDESIV